MPDFTEKMKKHAEHVLNVGTHCDSEETTKQALILPFLDVLGYNPYDPFKVKAEYYSDVPGVKRTERVDYALFSEGEVVMFVEAKSFVEKLGNHAPQLARYFNATPSVRVVALTNGREWKFFTDLKHENVMDEDPFFVVDFLNLKESDIEEFRRFCYGRIRSDSLRSFAEEQAHLSKFKNTIQMFFRDMDADFVRLVINKAVPTFRLTQKSIESQTPLVKRALIEAMSGMVANSFNVPLAAQIEDSAVPEEQEIDPNNPNIITTKDEKKILTLTQSILADQCQDGDLQSKDTESYYSVLYQGKNNRWLLRYYTNRKRPTVQFSVKLTEAHLSEVARAGMEITSKDHIYLDTPEHLMRLSGLLFDALDYCKNDENFKRQPILVEA